MGEREIAEVLVHLRDATVLLVDQSSATLEDMKAAAEGAREQIESARAALVALPSAPTLASERAAVVAEVGECCAGSDPLCAAGCLVEQALRKRAALPSATPGGTPDEEGLATFVLDSIEEWKKRDIDTGGLIAGIERAARSVRQRREGTA